MPTSRMVQSTSENAAPSATPAFGPNGMPIVRETSHTSATTRLPMMPARRSRREGFMTMATAHASCSHAVAAKKAPWYHVRLKWSPITAKWMPAAPSERTARPQRT